MDPPSSVRWELLSVEQRENETLERYLARLQKMILRAYPDTQTRQLSNPMFVDTFLKGCRDKAAALTACDKNPETIEEAYKYVKLSGQRRKAIFGKKNIVRTVSKHYDPAFASSSDSDQSISSPKCKYCVQGIQRLPNSNQNQVSTDKGKSLSEAGLLLKGLERIENMMRSGMPCVNSPGVIIVVMNAGSLGILLKIVQDAVILTLEVQVEEITHGNIPIIVLGRPVILDFQAKK